MADHRDAVPLCEPADALTLVVPPTFAGGGSPWYAGRRGTSAGLRRIRELVPWGSASALRPVEHG